MNAMLASVRSVEEARIVLAGACDWLDIKEPDHGALGQAPLAVVRDIVRLTAGRVPEPGQLAGTHSDLACHG